MSLGNCSDLELLAVMKTKVAAPIVFKYLKGSLILLYIQILYFYLYFFIYKSNKQF